MVTITTMKATGKETAVAVDLTMATAMANIVIIKHMGRLFFAPAPPQGPLDRVRGADLKAGADTIKRSLRRVGSLQERRVIGLALVTKKWREVV